jgi:hypothetical protein
LRKKRKRVIRLLVITQFQVIPQKLNFFQNKNKKNKIKAGNVEKAD